VLDALGWRSATVLGHSLGGYVGARLAARHPARVAALVIADMLTGWTDALETFARRQASRAPTTSASRAEAAARFRLTPPETAAPPERLRHLGEAGVVERGPGAWETAFDPRVFLHSPPDPWPFLPEVRCPTLVVRGAGSAIMSAEAAARAAATVARGTAATLPGAFHHLIVDDPDGYARLVLEWRAAFE
jgi:pimeloyl-ACP methyl ester carboxylesterase